MRAVSFTSLLNATKARRQTIVSVGWVTGAQSLTAVLAIVGGLIQARFIPPDVLGYYSAFTILAGYITFLHLGSLTALQREYPYWLGKGDAPRAYRAAAVTQGWTLCAGAAVLCLYVALGLWSVWRQDWMAAAGWASQLIVSSSFFTLYLGCTYRSTSEFVIWSKITAAGAILSFASVSMVVWLGYWGLCIKTLVPGIITVWMLFRFRPVRVNPVLHLKELWEQVKFALPMDMAGFLATSCMASVLGSIVLAKYGTEMLGLFAFAKVGEVALTQLAVSITQVFLPRINQRMGQTEDLRSCAVYAMKAAGACTLVMVLVSLACAIVCRPAVMLFVPKYESAIPILQVMMWVGLYPVLTLPRYAQIAAKHNYIVAIGCLSAFLVFIAGAGICVYFESPPVYLAWAYLLGKIAHGVVCYVSIWARVRGVSGPQCASEPLSTAAD